MAAKEVWVRSNRRVLVLAMVAPAALAAVGAGVLTAADGGVTRGIGWALIAVGAMLVLGVLGQCIRPRVAYRDGEVLFYLRPGPPVGVPVEAVEAFFLGQGPVHMPAGDDQSLRATNLVARISQKFPEWEHVAVKPALGRWAESYVTISGPWCEPLHNDFIRQLNHRLREIQQAAASSSVGGRSAATSSAPSSTAPSAESPRP